MNVLKYARTVVRHYATKGYGPRKIRDELYRRGVPREYWEEAMEERETDEDQVVKLARQKLRGAQPSRENLKKVSDYSFLSLIGFTLPPRVAGSVPGL